MKSQQFLTCIAIVHTVTLAWAAGPDNTSKVGVIVLSEPPPKLFNRQIFSF